MEIVEKIITSDERLKYILKDELGNIATGQTYEEASEYLILRRIINKRKR